MKKRNFLLKTINLQKIKILSIARNIAVPQK